MTVKAAKEQWQQSVGEVAGGECSCGVDSFLHTCLSIHGHQL